MRLFIALLILLPLALGMGGVSQAQEPEGIEFSKELGKSWEVALRRGDLEGIRKLVKQEPGLVGWLPKTIRGWRESFHAPLHFAAYKNRHDLIPILLELGADANEVTDAGRTAMHFVRSPAMVSRLLQAGLEPDAPDHTGITPMQAHSNWSMDVSLDIYRRLTEAGAELRLLEVIELGLEEEALCLIEKASLQELESPMMYAAIKSGSEVILRALLEKGLSPNCEAPPNPWVNVMNAPRPLESPLEVAALSDRFAAVAVLIEAGAHPDGVTSLEAWPKVRGEMLIDAKEGDLLDRAIEGGSLRAVDALLKLPFSPDVGEPIHRYGDIHDSRLVRAAWRGSLKIVERLHGAGADLNLRTKGASPLLAAAVAGHMDVYDRLLALGAKPDLHAAAVLGRVDEVRALIRTKPVSVNEAESRTGRTALAWAAEGGHKEVVAVLLAAGANPSAGVPGLKPNHRTMVPWPSGRLTLMPFISSWSGNGRRSAMALAVDNGHLELAAQLLVSGGKVDSSLVVSLCTSPHPRAISLLQVALKSQDDLAADPHWAYPGMVELLHPSGLGWPSKHKGTTEQQALAKLRLILDAGGSDQLTNADRKSVLSQATYRPTWNGVVDALVHAGAPVDIPIAGALGMFDRLRLLDAVHPLSQKDRGLQIHKAVLQDNLEWYRALVQGAPAGAEPDPMTSASTAAYHGSERILTYLVEEGVLTWQQLFSGRDSLFHRSASSSPGLLQDHLARGASIHWRGNVGMTPLHEACSEANVECIQVLLEAGASVDLRDDRGDTPLLSLLDSPSATFHPLSEAARLLLEAGADPLAVGYSNPSAYDYVLDEEDPERRSVLLKVFAPYLPEHYEGR